MVQPWWKALWWSADSKVSALVDWQSSSSPMKSSFVFSIPSPQSPLSHITTTTQGSVLPNQRTECWPCHLYKWLCWLPETAENFSAYKALLEEKKWQTPGLHERMLFLSRFGVRLRFAICLASKRQTTAVKERVSVKLAFLLIFPFKINYS